MKTTTFVVPLPGPLDLGLSLHPFLRWGDDLIDRWDGEVLVRTVPIEGRAVPFACRITGTRQMPALHVEVGLETNPESVQRALLTTFVAPTAEYLDLQRNDPVIGRLEGLYPGLRPVLQLDLCSALVRAISAQQVNLHWAVTTRRRLAEAFGDRHEIGDRSVYSLDPSRLAALSVADIRALQFTTRKAEYIIGVAQAIASGTLSLNALRACTDDEAIAHLIALRGIGLWTAEWLLSRVLGRPRVVAGDLAVRKAVGLAYLNQALPLESDVRGATRHWGRSAEIAQVLLLHGLMEGTLQP